MVTRELHAKLEDFNIKWGLTFTLHTLGVIGPKWKL